MCHFHIICCMICMPVLILLSFVHLFLWSFVVLFLCLIFFYLFFFLFSRPPSFPSPSLHSLFPCFSFFDFCSPCCVVCYCVGLVCVIGLKFGWRSNPSVNLGCSHGVRRCVAEEERNRCNVLTYTIYYSLKVLYIRKAFFKHAAWLHHGFPHCAIVHKAVSCRSSLTT